jgi:hypothetical protein
MSRTLVLTLLLAALSFAAPAHAAPISNFSQVFTDPHPVMTEGTIGFAYAGNKFVGSVQRDGTGALYSTDLNGGNVQVFAPTVSLAPNLASEHYVSSSLGLGGFPSRDIYVANANGVMHITNNGASSNVFVSGLTGLVRGITFDSVGTFANDMLITTNAGFVYRVNSAGTPTQLASVGEDTEGLDVAPLGNNFSTFDGQLIVASEGTGTIRAISSAGVVTPLLAINSAEELNFVPLNLGASGNPVEGFYGANYTPNVIKAKVPVFAGMQGDIIVTGELSGQVSRVHWNPVTQLFEVSNIGMFPNQPEDGLFVTADIINAPEPSSIVIALIGVGAAGFTVVRRRRVRVGAGESPASRN